jgi:hypothetical protein
MKCGSKKSMGKSPAKYAKGGAVSPRKAMASKNIKGKSSCHK